MTAPPPQNSSASGSGPRATYRLPTGRNSVSPSGRIYLGDYYPLTAVDLDERHWCGWQFDRPDLGQGFAMFFRRAASPDAAYDAHLNALEPDAQYDVSFAETYQVKEKRRMTGRQLASLRAEIRQSPGSILIRYTRERRQSIGCRRNPLPRKRFDVGSPARNSLRLPLILQECLRYGKMIKVHLLVCVGITGGVDPRRSSETAGEFVVHDHQDALEVYSRGLEYLDYNEPDQAILAFTEALHLNPQHVHAYFARGCAWAERGNLEKAIADYNEALRLDPNYAAAYSNRAAALTRLGNAKAAAADLERCRTLKNVV
jgi:tetratricopeptide (TPR) repeat protein